MTSSDGIGWRFFVVIWLGKRWEPPRQKFFEFLPPLRGRGIFTSSVGRLVRIVLYCTIVAGFLRNDKVCG